MSDDQIKYLEMIQALVERLASNSFVLKGWSVTVATALLGFAGSQQNAQVALLTLLPTLSFWGLDAYYLAQERRYRTLFGRVRKDQSTAFSFDAPELGFREWVRASFSVTTLFFHSPIVAVTVYLYFHWGTP